MKKKIFYILSLVLILIIPVLFLFGCDEKSEISKTVQVGDKLSQNQPTPTDIDYSLERYNLIKRAYWVNGQREKAMALPCAIKRPLGYIILFTSSGAIVGRFIVDGKVTYLNHWLSPIEWELYWKENSSHERLELPDVDGCYGDNVDGIFFFTTDGKYIEWTGDYLYSDIPFNVDDPILKTE